ncbi:glycoside hydrolase family 28 protein [Flavisolibacter ginsenosidimutans]|uniref:Glycoside hydrolase family 28 protein n=1 Tax=Flavisolibacter ginsenosidimutans TaxID=661481 RepID=A0A5B8UH10_9BACT|nr:glycoside hydrolase family 28 protein [Flavisolibacter ginsenosidimutans]QEC55692.1 glycoside hydrolase family 28 protein [Flavisolibacter ginsenosidimutans]
MIRLFFLVVCSLLLHTLSAQSYYNVINYGAKNDSSAKCTKAIAAAIDAASKKGGGTVYFPAGKYLTGPIHLKSNITIFIDAGAEISFSNDFDDYMPFVESRFEGEDVMSFSPLFYAYKAENISIIGRGKINGNGKKWWDAILNYKEGNPKTKWQTAAEAANKNMVQPDDLGQLKSWILRPPFIQPMYCKNVLIQGITIVNSPFWTVNPEFCENVTVDGVTINNPHSPNTDGINPESCKYVHIANCHISVGDDCITIKSGKDKPGRLKAAPAENYTITNCTMLAGHGGVVIGSEMSGDVRKITISNCVFDGTDRGIRIKTARGRGGVVEEVRVSNIIMKNIKQQAVVLDMQYAKTQPEPVSERTPRFRNIHMSNITAQTAQAIYINGIAEMPVEDITFNDIQFDAQTGAVIKEAKNIELHNVRITTQQGSSINAENVSDLTIDGVKTLKPIAGKPVIDLVNVQNVFLYNCNPVKGTETFLNVRGDKTKTILLKNNNFMYASKPLVKDSNVQEDIKVE